MKSTYINYLRLINNKLIREGIYLPIKISDDMTVTEVEEVKTIIEGYCYFNDVLSKCDSAYALQLVNGCSGKLYTDVVKEDVFKKYKDKFDNALSLLCQDTPNPLDSKVTVASLSNYLSKNGKDINVEDLAVEVRGVSEDTNFSFQYSDIFSIKQTRDLEYTDDSDSDEDFDYSEDFEESENLDSEDDIDSDDVYYDFTEGYEDDEEDFDYSSEEYSVDEEDSYEDDFDYSDDTEVIEELPISDDNDSVFFDFNGVSQESQEDVDSDDIYYDEDTYSESSDISYDEDTYDDDEISYDDDDVSYDDDEISYEDDEVSYEDDEISYEDDEVSYEDDEISYEDDDISYEDDVYEDESEDFDYEEDSYTEDDSDFDYSDSDSYDEDEDEFSYDESENDSSDMPVFNVGSTQAMQSTHPRKKEDYERSAETIQGIVDGGTRILKRVGVKMKDSFFSKKD